VVTPTCSITLNQLIDLAAKLFPAGAQRNAVVTALKALPPRAQDRLSLAIRKAAFSIIDIATKAYTAGKLNPQATPADLLAFIQGMYCFVGLTPPTIPQPIDKNEFATAVITSNSGPTTVEPPSKHGGLQFQGTTLPAGVPAVTIFVTKLPDTPGPLFTSLDQFPQFYEFSAFPEVTFTKNVLAGVCQAQNLAESSSLLLAHNVLPKFGAGAVEVLPHVDPTFLNCLDIVGNVGLLGGVREFFASALLPTQLHASTSLMTTVGTGGNLKHLSPFGSVNPGSNPGSIGTVDANGQPTDGSVSGADSVYVKATSKNGTPIQKLPVAFGQDTVLTKESGIAAFKWDATPGTTLTATVLNELGCPGTNPGTAYLPKVCFSPNSVTFTAPSPEPLGLNVSSVEKLTGGTEHFFVQSGGPGPYIWSVNGVDGGNSIYGLITTNQDFSADYTAPSTVPSPAGFNVCARRSANQSESACASVTISPIPSSGADVIVFNDINIFDQDGALDGNNVQLFKNLVSFTASGPRASGQTVLIHYGHASLCASSGDPGCTWTTFQSTLTGQGFTVTTGNDLTAPLTSIASNVKVIILVVPTTAYSHAEINSLKAFAGQAGRILFVGEHVGFYGSGRIGVENQFLADMGAVMQNTGGAVDCANPSRPVLPSSSLRSHQVTEGLTQLTVACASVLNPGPNDYPLFYDTSNQQVLGAVAKVDLTSLALISNIMGSAEVAAPTSIPNALSQAVGASPAMLSPSWAK